MTKKKKNDLANEREAPWWYAACGFCTAKWYAPFKPVRCPRCGRLPLETIPQTPPWLRDVGGEDDRDLRDTENEDDVEVSTNG